MLHTHSFYVTFAHLSHLCVCGTIIVCVIQLAEIRAFDKRRLSTEQRPRPPRNECCCVCVLYDTSIQI